MISNQHKIQHLYWRAGFGPPLAVNPELPVKNDINSLFTNSKTAVPLEIKNWNPTLAIEAKNMTAADKAAYRKQERQARIQLNQDIIERFAFSKSSLREKMTLFWMGHFACRIANPLFIVKYYNTIHNFALGKFSDLLKEMIRNASLLQYLNNNQNRKSNPNENFARELMELFTIGIGNYTETDVKEGARALTGWGFDRFGEFAIREEHHDSGVKMFLGEEGDFDGDDLARILLKQKKCASFITSKIYRYFVNEIPDKKIIEELSSKFYASGYDVEGLLKNIFTSEWFYDDANIGSKIKSPIELLTGMMRNFKIKIENPMMQIQIQKVLGQLLFDPPNVAGWSGGRAWVDSSTLMYRMRLPELLLQEAESILAPKEEFDALEILKTENSTRQNGKKVKTIFDRREFDNLFSKLPDSKKADAIIQFLLQSPPGDDKIVIIEKLISGNTGNERTFKTAIYVMSLPEYQLC